MRVDRAPYIVDGWLLVLLGLQMRLPGTPYEKYFDWSVTGSTSLLCWTFGEFRGSQLMIFDLICQTPSLKSHRKSLVAMDCTTPLHKIPQLGIRYV